ncbi:MAG: hypothetical protein ABI832_20245 [bacterium]
MRLSDALIEFLAGPVMILLGSRTATNVPDAGRSVGLRLSADAQSVDLVTSRWQWPQTVENVAATGGLAVTLSRPTDYVTYQIKGRARLQVAGPDDIALAERYMARMHDLLTGLGVDPLMAATWFCARDPVVLRLTISQVFVQTPGAQAGSAVGATT